MTWDNAAWMVKGARHSAEIGRLLAYVASSGAEGIIEPSDLRVVPYATPGAGFRVLTGACIIRNRYSGGGQQSYAARNPTEDVVDRAGFGTGSGSGRSDLVVVRIEDPQYPGTAAPPDPLIAQYPFTRVIQGVPSGTTTAKELNLGYPAIALARIDYPANTSTITSAMIKDLRKVAVPRRDRQQEVTFPVTLQNIPTSSYARWPLDEGATLLLSVPEWATALSVVCHLSGVKYAHAGTVDTVAGLRLAFDGAPGQNGIMVESSSGRGHYTVAGEWSVSSAQRGTTREIVLQAVRTAGTGLWQADYQMMVVMDAEFNEVASS